MSIRNKMIRPERTEALNGALNQLETRALSDDDDGLNIFHYLILAASTARVACK